MELISTIASGIISLVGWFLLFVAFLIFLLWVSIALLVRRTRKQTEEIIKRQQNAHKKDDSLDEVVIDVSPKS